MSERAGSELAILPSFRFGSTVERSRHGCPKLGMTNHPNGRNTRPPSKAQQTKDRIERERLRREDRDREEQALLDAGYLAFYKSLESFLNANPVDPLVSRRALAVASSAADGAAMDRGFRPLVMSVLEARVRCPE